MVLDDLNLDSFDYLDALLALLAFRVLELWLHGAHDYRHRFWHDSLPNDILPRSFCICWRLWINLSHYESKRRNRTHKCWLWRRLLCEIHSAIHWNLATLIPCCSWIVRRFKHAALSRNRLVCLFLGMYLQYHSPAQLAHFYHFRYP